MRRLLLQHLFLISVDALFRNPHDMPETTLSPKYQKPRILLIDMPPEIEQALRVTGYNVTIGSFGGECYVEPSNSLHPVPEDTIRLENCSEQEIVFVNLERASPTDFTLPEPGIGVDAIWQSAQYGSIDPRPIGIRRAEKMFNRIFNHGGIFVYLAGEPYNTTYIQGRRRHDFTVNKDEEVYLSSTPGHSPFQELQFVQDDGDEIKFADNLRGFGELIKKGANGARYTTVIDIPGYYKSKWESIAVNKYGKTVSAIRFPTESEPGTVIILPQMPGLHAIIVELLETWFPLFNGKLFPFHDKQSWLHSEEYEVPAILKLMEESKQIRERADSAIEELKARIEEAREANRDWYCLLNGTGDELVQAVINALTNLGFAQVVDIDKQAAEASGVNKREDLQIRDRDPVLIVDVKGIGGTPEDAACMQSEKHALMRGREFAGKVKPLTIINHQRNLPPHERNSRPFREEIIANARGTGLGLMTTWDLFRIMRLKEDLGWPEESVKDIFYRTGRIEVIPSHYQSIGEIVHAWTKRFGIIPSKDIEVGARMAIEIDQNFVEVEAVSLMVDNKNVQLAASGSNCGVCANLDIKFRVGANVYLIRSLT